MILCAQKVTKREDCKQHVILCSSAFKVAYAET